jgi:hypothetical protein
MPKTKQWLLFKYIDGQFTIETPQNETTRRESALEISGARTQEDWGRGGSHYIVGQPMSKSLFMVSSEV